LCEWLEFVAAYTGTDERAVLSPVLSRWLLAAAQTSRVPEVIVEAVESLMRTQCGALEFERIQRNADALRARHFSAAPTARAA
jgi:hypothetical protein